MPERLIHKLHGYMKPLYAKYYQNKLNNTDFTIISNNCWGGIVYEWFGLEKLSPTVGCYFFAADYIKFLKDIRSYLSKTLEIVSAGESRHAEILERKGQTDVPVGILGDVEIIFLHYKDPSLVREKWNRRVERINWNNLIYKFSYMNGCDEALLNDFESIQGVKKICFVNKAYPLFQDTVIMPYLDSDGQVGDDTFYWNKNYDVVGFFNSPLENIQEYWRAQKKKASRV